MRILWGHGISSEYRNDQNETGARKNPVNVSTFHIIHHGITIEVWDSFTRTK